MSQYAEIVFDGESLCLVSIEALDLQRNLDIMCERTAFLNCQGGKIIALGSGNPADLSTTSCEKITLFSGKALAIIKKNHSDDIELQDTF
ncbi:hypothetical protein [uncultured Vagococcus sp.]|uniref:hypothetical protein n=1 Tax=uncultured Vagococcus sp. TaxID=189676 RepID=UPI0028D27145|nr:hypothetical protein [uncultured Vagococcus sp.]